MYEIIPAQKDCCAVLAAISYTCGRDVWSSASFESEFDKESVIMIAREDGNTVGFVVLGIMIDEGYIHNLAVLPEYRSRGIGAGLITAAADAAGRSLKRIVLDVRESNKAAIRLYKRLGFEKECKRKRMYSEPVEDGITMIKVINQ